jgi:hypothetical protein
MGVGSSFVTIQHAHNLISQQAAKIDELIAKAEKAGAAKKIEYQEQIRNTSRCRSLISPKNGMTLALRPWWW